MPAQFVHWSFTARLQALGFSRPFDTFESHRPGANALDALLSVTSTLSCLIPPPIFQVIVSFTAPKVASLLLTAPTLSGFILPTHTCPLCRRLGSLFD